MKLITSRPGLQWQLLWIPYLVIFFLENAFIVPKYIIHCPLDDLIPFCEWFAFPYCSWFLLLAGVTLLLWWNDTPAYYKLVKMMFSGMFFCLFLYILFPNGLHLRPETIDRQNIAVLIMQTLWGVDEPANVCPSIHCQSSACMALAFSQSRLARGKWGWKLVAWGWALLICLSTVFTKQHSAVDVALGLILVIPWYFILYYKKDFSYENRH